MMVSLTSRGDWFLPLLSFSMINANNKLSTIVYVMPTINYHLSKAIFPIQTNIHPFSLHLPFPCFVVSLSLTFTLL